MFVQSKSSLKNGNGSSAEVAACQICRKTEKETEFSIKEKKRLGKGEPATCKQCANNKTQRIRRNPSVHKDLCPSTTAPETPNELMMKSISVSDYES